MWVFAGKKIRTHTHFWSTPSPDTPSVWSVTAWAVPPAGKMASRIAVDTFLAELEKVLTKGMTPQQLREASSYAVSLANKAIREAAKDTEEYANMGTTLVSAVTYPDGVAVINVGDSRAYHISQAGITRITKDHSLVESMVERGDITAEEARRHPTATSSPGPGSGCSGGVRWLSLRAACGGVSPALHRRPH